MTAVGRRSVRRPVARQHGQLAGPSTAGAGSAACRAVAGTRPPPSAEAGPAQPVEVLGAEHEVQTAAERVAVDEQDPLAGAHGRDRDGGGEDRRAGAARDRRRRRARPRRRRPPSAASASAATSHDSASGSDTTCSAPTATACSHTAGGGAPAHRDDHAPAAGQPALGARPGRGRVEQDERGVRPVPPRLRGIDRPDQLAPGGGRHAEQRVEQLAVRHHDEPPATVDLAVRPRAPPPSRRCSSRRPALAATPSPAGPVRAAGPACGPAAPWTDEFAGWGWRGAGCGTTAAMPDR